jgi:hypothetical protein
MRASFTAVSILIVGLGGPAFAQEPPEIEAPPIIEGRSGPDWIAGGDFLVGQPLGAFDQNVGTGFGLAGHLVLAIPDGVLGLRLEAAGLVYGRETISVPLSPTIPRISTDVTTENWIMGLTIGPELMLRRGPIRPYVHALLGFSYFSTTSEAAGEDDLLPFARSTNYDDFTFALRLGGGLRVPFGASSVALDLGVRYVYNGRVSYLTEGDLYEDADGNLVITPRRSDANMLEFVVGVTFGL